MKKLLFIPALLVAASTLAIADTNKYEFSPLIGYNFADKDLRIKDDGHPLLGLELQINTPDSRISPEFSVLYSPTAEDKDSGEDTSIFRGAFNAVYTFDKASSVIPFLKVGAGFENMSEDSVENENGFFLDAGAGLKVPFTDTLAFKLETIYMLKDIADERKGNLVILAGLSFGFGDTADKAAPVQKEEPKEEAKSTPVIVAVVDGDEDNDGILNSLDECPRTPTNQTVDSKGCFLDADDDNDGILNTFDSCLATKAGAKVDTNGCIIDGDDDNDGVYNASDRCTATKIGVEVDASGCSVDNDNDGVKNSIDQCANSVTGEPVDENGCAKSINLNIVFENGSSRINRTSQANIQRAADFLRKNPSYSAKIVGHSDSVGKASSNKALSLKRANSVKGAIIAKGINANRLSASGMGEENPVADNSTKEGRAQNRRIEALLSRS